MVRRVDVMFMGITGSVDWSGWCDVVSGFRLNTAPKIHGSTFNSLFQANQLFGGIVDWACSGYYDTQCSRPSVNGDSITNQENILFIFKGARFAGRYEQAGRLGEPVRHGVWPRRVAAKRSFHFISIALNWRRDV